MMDTTGSSCILCSLKGFKYQTNSLQEYLKHIRAFHKNKSVNCIYPHCSTKRFNSYNSYYQHCRRSHNIHENILGDGVAKTNHFQQEHDITNNSEEDDDTAHNESILIGLDISLSQESNNIVGDENISQTENLPVTESVAQSFDFSFKHEHFLAFSALKLKEENCLTQVALDKIIRNTHDVIQIFAASVTNSIQSIHENNNEWDIFNFKDALSYQLEKFENQYEQISTSYLQEQYYTKHFNLSYGNEIIFEDGISSMFYMPVKETLIALSKLPNFQNMLINIKNDFKNRAQPPNHISTTPFLLKSFRNGKTCEQHSVFSSELSLPLVLYFDDLEICNPLGSKSSIHKLSMFYFTLTDLPDYAKSKLGSIFLLGIAKSAHVKKIGLDTVLLPFYKEMRVLSKDGINFMLNGESINFKVDLALFSGDTLAANQFSGFKEGVGFAYRKCRNCMATFETMNKKFLESNFGLRNKSTHLKFFEGKHNTVLSGVNRLSAIFNMDHFDAFACIPFDPMHILLEGCIPYTMKEFLVHFIKNKKCLTLNEFNKILSEFKYDGHDKTNKPSIVLNQHILESGNLRQSASQIWTLARLIPMMLCEYCDVNDKVWKCFLILLQITSIIFSFELNSCEICNLRELIKQYLKTFKECFPTKNIIPKQHYLIHVPTNLENLGPCRTFWCMRFEARHSSVKELSAIANYKNIVKYMAKRMQRKFCLDLLNNNIMYTKVNYHVASSLDFASKMEIQEAFEVSINEADAVLKWLTFNSLKFTNEVCVFMHFQTDMPCFGIIKLILKQSESFFFIIQTLKTVSKNLSLNCFVCENSNEPYCLKNFEDLKYIDTMAKYYIDNNIYIPIKYSLHIF